MELTVVILAAGQGKRMHSDLPKVLHLLAGKPLLRHVLNTARKLNPKKIIIVSGYGADQVMQSFSDADLIWAHQDPPRGTADAVRYAMPHIKPNEQVLTLYGDVPCIEIDGLHELLKAKNEFTLVSASLANPMGYGRILRDSHGLIQSIVEEKDASAEQRLIDEVNTGIFFINGKLLHDLLPQIQPNNAQGEYYLTDLVMLASQSGKKVGSLTVENAEPWFGVNSQSDLVTMERALQKKQAEELLTSGVYIADLSRFDLRGNLKCGKDVHIDVGCIFEGEVSISDKVRVGAYSIIKNSVIKAGTIIKPFTIIEGAEIGPDSQIGPYARIRPGTKLESSVHIGNFVEVKNSQIASNSKANHLSYIGDSDIGERVNVGAGTITCNYDGANKHRTIIEDDVFIGSDSQLVAPVTIGKGATIGAGTTVTKDAPANQLTIGRAKQSSHTGWKRPLKTK